MPVNTIEEILYLNPWLDELADIYTLLTDLVLNAVPPELMAAYVRDTDTYKARFPGMATRLKAGLPAITEADYLDVESSYQTIFRSWEVYDSLFSSRAQFRAWAADRIGSDWSAAELSRRIDSGWASVVDNRPQIAEAFQDYYGVVPSDTSLLLYFLDPERGFQQMEKEVATAIVGGEALAYGLNVSRTRAELFAAEGVDQEMARQGYADIAREAPLLGKLARIHNLTPITQTDLEDLFFHENPEVVKRRRQQFEIALNEFREGSLGNVSQEGGLAELLDRRRTI